MRTLVALVGLAAVAVALAKPATIVADSSSADRLSVAICQQFTLTLEVEAPVGATVDPDPLAPGWSGVEVVRINSHTEELRGEMILHRFELLAAAFLPDSEGFTPGVVIVTRDEALVRALPHVGLAVVSSLAPDAPLKLSPLPRPVVTHGEQSAFLIPALTGAVLVALAVLAMLVIVGVTYVRGRPARPALPAIPPKVVPDINLEGAEELLRSEPVKGYRLMGYKVRAEVARRYGFPASALTTGEIGKRMEREGVDRWAARLVSGLLQECDAVVYAGYRPAGERRRADLTMAREILEGGA